MTNSGFYLVTVTRKRSGLLRYVAGKRQTREKVVALVRYEVTRDEDPWKLSWIDVKAPLIVGEGFLKEVCECIADYIRAGGRPN